jgi:hypothetical protein
MINFILNASILLLVIFFTTYFMYCFGLFFVFRKLNARAWMAFVPILNFRELVIATGLPNRWFLYCLIPYAGGIYSIAVAERLGKMFGKNFAFSAFWLTLGSPLGMNILGFSKIEPNKEIAKNPSPNLDQLKEKLKRIKKTKVD